MFVRGSIGCVVLGMVMVLALSLSMTSTGAQAQDLSKYPDWKGEWSLLGGRGFDPAKGRGLAQEAPLIPEYQAILEASLADLEAGGQGNDHAAKCLPEGMPRMMLGAQPLEFIITPEITYVPVEHFGQLRRIYTDGRPWPETIEPTFSGYSIGRWVDADGDGRFDTLLVESRGFRGPRNFDSSGGIMHNDNQSVFKEQLALDKTNPDVMHNQLTVIDHALTRPWTVTRDYRRRRNTSWFEYTCNTGDNPDVFVGNDHYMVSVDGYLMPTKKNQAPPDLRYFKQTQR